MDKCKIVVFLKEGDIVASFSSADVIVVFEKKQTEWVKIKRAYVNEKIDETLGDLRTAIRGVGDFDDCRIVAGADISGIVYQELSRMGFSIFEINKCTPDVLDGILSDVEAAEREAEEAGRGMTSPVETGTPGIFFLDLVRLQEARPDITSKQALQTFLEKAPFYELHLACAHVPPWIENGPYEVKMETADNGSSVAVIRKKRC